MNTQLFDTKVKARKAATARNAAGGKAYDPGVEHALAQMAMTSTLADSYYVKDSTQLKKVLAYCAQVDPEYVAKLAVYAREQGKMKDLPCLLVAYLAGRNEHELLDAVFHRVIDNGKMVRNYVQIIRSGVTGKRGLGSQSKRLLRGWFAAQGVGGVFRNSTGSNPSMADVIRLARPVPLTDAEREMYRYLIGKGEHTGPAYELLKWSKDEGEMPKLPFEFLSGYAKTKDHWEDIAHGLSWNATLKNLNTFARHGVSKRAWAAIEKRLLGRVPGHVFPYSIMTAYRYIDNNTGIPMPVKLAVQDALDNSLGNVPALPGTVAVCVDVSGSMGSSVTGYRRGATSVTRCVDVAALVAAAIQHKNPETRTILFDTIAREATLNPRDSVVTKARQLACHGGGTDVSCALGYLVDGRRKQSVPDLTIIVSDNQSWLDPVGIRYWGARTNSQEVWDKMAGRNKNAKLVCLDIQAEPTVQVKSSRRVLNLGGFSDIVFKHIAEFAEGNLSAEYWTNAIKSVKL